MDDFSFLSTFRPFASLAHIFFLSAASLKDTCMGAVVGGRGTTETAGEAPTELVVSSARRSGVFSLSTIPSGMLASSWLVLT